MYLYNKNEEENLLEVYSLMPKENLIREFKIKEMEQIPENERVLKAVSNYRPVLQTFFGGPLSCINYGNEQSIISRYHKLIEYKKKELEKAREFLEAYYMQSENRKLLVVDEHTGNEKYFILFNGSCYGWENRRLKPGRFKMDGIIQLPQSLYILENLYFGNGNVVNDYDISDLMEFFYFKDTPKEVYDLQKIDSLQAFGLIDNTLSSDRLESNSKLVKRLKDYNRDYN